VVSLSRAGRAEVEAAWRHFVAVGDSGDWNAWADLHSENSKKILYNPREAEEVMKRWVGDGGKLPARRG